jgi:hypothetical protein
MIKNEQPGIQRRLNEENLHGLVKPVGSRREGR